MKKTIAFLLTVILLLSLAVPAFGAWTDPDAEDFGIAKGYVRTKEVEIDENGETSVASYIYNKQGNLIEYHTVSSAYPDAHLSCSYDKKGQLISVVAHGEEANFSTKLFQVLNIFTSVELHIEILNQKI